LILIGFSGIWSPGPNTGFLVQDLKFILTILFNCSVKVDFQGWVWGFLELGYKSPSWCWLTLSILMNWKICELLMRVQGTTLWFPLLLAMCKSKQLIFTLIKDYRVSFPTSFLLIVIIPNSSGFVLLYFVPKTSISCSWKFSLSPNPRVTPLVTWKYHTSYQLWSSQYYFDCWDLYYTLILDIESFYWYHDMSSCTHSLIRVIVDARLPFLSIVLLTPIQASTIFCIWFVIKVPDKLNQKIYDNCHGQINIKAM
jgi:hypothetical protein